MQVSSNIGTCTVTRSPDSAGKIGVTVIPRFNSFNVEGACLCGIFVLPILLHSSVTRSSCFGQTFETLSFLLLKDEVAVKILQIYYEGAQRNRQEIQAVQKQSCQAKPIKSCCIASK